ncbi:MAG: NAD(P)H-dependent oxidoreductase [Phycisphaerales bacterium]|nr:NAD(P)H-dependent oxidoreductase [Phycisphaerales bacterium]
MTTILHLDSSARLQRSLTRKLSALFVESWRSHEPDARIIYRDLGRNPPAPVSEEWIAAAFTAPHERTPDMERTLAPSDEMIEELSAANVIVLGAPMYNYGLPAALKAWVDQVVRVGRTFSFDLARGDFPVMPILVGKRFVVLSSRGEFGFANGGPRDGWNHLNPHIRTIATRLFGIPDSDIHEVAVEYQEFKDERHARSLEEAQERVLRLATRLAEAVTKS